MISLVCSVVNCWPVNMASPPEVDESSPGPNENLYSLDSLPSEAREQIRKLQEREQPVNILVVGPVGTGKSTLVNSLLGRVVAPVGHSGAAVTQEVKEYTGEFLEVEIKVYDTVGFFYAGGKSERDIMNEIESRNENFDLVLICLKLEERFNDIARKLFHALRGWLTLEMWERSVVVLTQTDKFLINASIPRDDDGRAAAIRSKIEEFKQSIIDFIPENERGRIPFRVSGKSDERNLPTTDDWLFDLWESCIMRCSEETSGFFAYFWYYIYEMKEAIRCFLKRLRIVS